MNGSGRTGRATWTLIVVASLACGACELRLGVDVALNRDGGGVLAVSVAADEELLERAEAAGADPLGDLADAGADLGGGWRVREATADDGAATVTLRSEFADPEGLTDLTEELAGALEADEVDLLDPMSVTLTDEEITLDGAAGMRPTAVVREYGMTPREAVRLLQRTEAFTYTVSVVMPGALLDGADASGRTQTLTIEPGQRQEFTVVAQRPGPPWVRGVLGAVGGGLVAALLLVVLARRRRRREPV